MFKKFNTNILDCFENFNKKKTIINCLAKFKQNFVSIFCLTFVLKYKYRF